MDTKEDKQTTGQKTAPGQTAGEKPADAEI